MAYIPPVGGSVGLDFVGPVQPVTGGDANLEFSTVGASIRQAGGFETSNLGTPGVANKARFLRPEGTLFSGVGTPTASRNTPRIAPASINPRDDQVPEPTYVRWRQYLGAIGIAVPAESFFSVTRVRLVGGYSPPPGSNAVLNWGSETYSPPPGSNIVIDFGALGSGRVIGVTLFDQSSFGAPSLFVPTGLRPVGIASTNLYGRPTVSSGTQAVSLSGFSIAPGPFGAAVLSSRALGVFAVGIPSASAIGTPFIAYRIRYLSPLGSSYYASGATNVQGMLRYLRPSGWSSSTLAPAPVVTPGVRSIAVAGFGRFTFGDHAIDNSKRFLNQISWSDSVVPPGAKVWDGKQFIDKVTLGDGMFVPTPIVSVPVGPPDKTQYLELSGKAIDIPDNQVWPLHAVENRTKQAFAEGFTSYAVPSPKVDQTIYLTIRPLGADWSVFGTAFVDQTIKKLAPSGWTSPFVSTNHQIYNFRIDVVAGGLNSYVSGTVDVRRGTARPIVPGIAPKSVVSSALRVEYRVRSLAPTGFVASLWGNALFQNRNIAVSIGGIQPPSQTGSVNGERAVPNPVVTFRLRYLGGAGNINTFDIPNKHSVTHYTQALLLQDSGIAPPPVPGPNVNFRNRTIFPTFILGPNWGVTTFKRKIVVEPLGWDSSFLSSNAELLRNTQRVEYYTGDKDETGYGVASVFNWIKNVDLNRQGFSSEWVTAPRIENKIQHITVSEFYDNKNPDEWPNYQPDVYNKDRELRTFGPISSKVSTLNWVRNKGEPFFPAGWDSFTFGKESFIGHYTRYIRPEGWDSFYNERYSVVWNTADVLAPSGIAPGVVGKPSEVANLNRTVKHHSGWEGPEIGTAFIAYAVRTVKPSLFYDVPAAFPEVRHNPFPVSPKGIPQEGQVGGHDLHIFFREILPKSVNVHSLTWVGEPTIRSRTQNVAPYAYEQTEFGRTSIANYTRYLEPEGRDHTEWTNALIQHRERTIPDAGKILPPQITVLHRVRNVQPDPPGPQKILLNYVSVDGVEADGFGIRPPGMAGPSLRRNQVWPEAWTEITRWGVPKVWGNNLLPPFIFEDGLTGIPTIIYTQIVEARSIESRVVVNGPIRIDPCVIYAPGGIRADGGTIGSGAVMDATQYVSRNGSRWPAFGDPEVSTLNRRIGPVPQRGGGGSEGFDFFPKFGTTSVVNRKAYVYPSGIRSLRFGQIVFLNVPQYVNLDTKNYHQGIDSILWGTPNIGPPPVQPDYTSRVSPMGASMTRWGGTRVELLHRTVRPTGIAHQSGGSNINPYGTALIGYPRRFPMVGFDATIWGKTDIDFKNRTRSVEGWNSCSFDSFSFDDFKSRMRVTRLNPKTAVPSIQTGEKFGTAWVSTSTRSVAARGIDGYNGGDHSVRAETSIFVQGWVSTEFGDIDKWEAGKIKAHGDDLSSLGTPRLLHPLRAFGAESSVFGAARIGSQIVVGGIPEPLLFGPTVTNPFGCTNRAVSPLPILSTQTVSKPVVA